MAAMLQSVAGIVFVSLLPFKRKIANEDRPPREVGIAPVSLSLDKVIEVSVNRFPREVGIEPIKPLESMYRFTREVRPPIKVEIVPVTETADNFICVTIEFTQVTSFQLQAPEPEPNMADMGLFPLQVHPPYIDADAFMLATNLHIITS